jgi:Bacterial DNA-binding protein
MRRSAIEMDGPTFIMRGPDDEQISLEEFHRAVQELEHLKIHGQEREGRNPQTGEPLTISASQKVAAIVVDGVWEQAFHYLDGISPGDFGYQGPVASDGSTAIEVLFLTESTRDASKQLAKALRANTVTYLGTPAFTA